MAAIARASTKRGRRGPCLRRQRDHRRLHELAHVGIGAGGGSGAALQPLASIAKNRRSARVMRPLTHAARHHDAPSPRRRRCRRNSPRFLDNRLYEIWSRAALASEASGQRGNSS